MPKFKVDFRFKIEAITRDYTIEANSIEDAIEKASKAIDQYGYLKLSEFEKLGGDYAYGTWDTMGGTDHSYRVDLVDEIGGEDE